MKPFFLIFVFFIINFPSNSAEIISSNAKYQDGVFLIDATSTIKASPENIFKILTDYPNISKISPKIIESKILSKNTNGTKIKTIVEGCVLFFCKEIVNTQLVTTNLNQDITSVTIPEESNLKSGKMFWKLTKKGNVTEIKYFASLEPDFFVPPLIGAFFIKRSMLSEANNFVITTEKLAKKNADGVK